MTLNISTSQSKTASSGRRAAKQARPLVGQVVDELTMWNPREFITAFQRWHQGSVSLVHLNVLALLEASGPMPMGRLAEQLDISVASITGVIDRMEARGLVEAHWGVTENGRRARYYDATAAGKAHLRAETKKWLRYSAVVTGLLTTSVAGRTAK